MYPSRIARVTPEKAAIVMSEGTRVTYGELDDRSTQLARALRSRGLDVGAQVAMWAENHPRYYEAYWAAMRSGFYFTGVNRFSTPDEAAYVLADSGAQALITTQAMAERAVGVLALIDGCPNRLMIDGGAPGYERYEEVISAESTEPLVDEPRGALMLYSSGTTGRPKGIRRDLPGLRVDDPRAVRPSDLGRLVLGLDDTSVYLMPAPLYHAAALQWSVGVQELGGTVVVMEKFEPERMLQLIETHRVSDVQVVPTMMVRLLKLPRAVREKYDLSSLKSFVHAAAPCPPDVKRQMIDWLGPIVHEYYAATEGIGLTYISAPDWLDHPGSVGQAVLGTIRICDEAGSELPPGTPGTIYFERDAPAFEYHNDEAKTRDACHPAHPTWATAGDMGYVDRDGYLYLTDRKAFMIISGGVNIYPAEIESCLIMHPAVADVAVFGLPDPDMGEYVQAVVQPTDPDQAGPGLAEELLHHARERLSAYKVPRRVDFRETVPRLATGKLLKGDLRAEYLAEAT
jgi:fatty-acyl-CoA synthase